MKCFDRFAFSTVVALSLFPHIACSQATQPPKTWVDRDTGHRVYRLSDEPGSSAFYFNVNAYSPDKRFMIYTAPDGIHTLEMSTHKTRLLVPSPPHSAEQIHGGNHAIVVGHKTDSIFFSRPDADNKTTAVYKADMNTGTVTKLATLPPRSSIATINADETLGAGVYDETEAGTLHEYGRNGREPAVDAQRERAPLVQPESKGAMMERRLAAHIPVVLFTVDLSSGKVHELFHSTDWIGHLLFSPIDPSLLMYCHEGPWQKVDRIWTIHTDGSHNTLMHKRTMLMEIAGHEFWGIDGETIWYDWQLPKGEDFWLAGYNLADHKRVAYHMLRDEWSIHFNINEGSSLFCGDGGDPGQVAHAKDGEWIYLFHPEWRKNDGGIEAADFIKPGIFHSERLVNMSRHNYRLEPNVRFSPDSKMVLFTSNMFGPSYVFGVEVEKAAAGASDILSTPELGLQFAPAPSPAH